MHGFPHGSSKELESILTEAIAALRPELLKLCDHYALFGSRAFEIETVCSSKFFAGKNGNRLLYYDDARF
jgi:hypothetical protein